jgi:hypothetical protein
MKILGDIIIHDVKGKNVRELKRIPKEDHPILKLEMWLNGEVATQAYEKFGMGLRVHLKRAEFLNLEDFEK